jgi:hypothetical protein
MNNSLPLADRVSDAIEQYLVAKNLREESSKPKKFYISDMGKCMRIRYLKRKGIASELSPFVYWIFEMGNMIHDFGYKALEAQSLLLATEEPFETEHFSGRYDGKVRDIKPTLFDFKSAGEYAMKKAIAGGDSEENIAQILTTVMLKKDAGEEVADSGLLIYMNKEPKDQMPKIAFTREYVLTNVREKALRNEMDTLVNYWVDDKIPPCTCPAWMKPYNSYLPFCSMTEKDVKKYLNLMKNGQKLVSTKTKIFGISKNELEEDVRKELAHL